MFMLAMVLVCCCFSIFVTVMLLLQRYYYYIHNGVQKDMLATQPKQQLLAIQDLVPQQFLTTALLACMRNHLLDEIDADYEFSSRKSIGLYSLLELCQMYL